MFCIKCGSQVADNAKFCQKCGTPIAVVDSVQQPSTEPVSTASQKPVEPLEPLAQAATNPVMPEPQQLMGVTIPPETQEAYDLLKKNAASCPKIKNITLKKQKFPGAPASAAYVVLKIMGLFYGFIYVTNFRTRKPLIKQSSSWLYYVISVPIAFIDAIFFRFLVEGYAFAPLTVLLLVGCIAWVPVIFFAHKERAEIIAYIYRTLQCGEQPSSAFFIISLVMNIGLFLLGIGSLSML